MITLSARERTQYIVAVAIIDTLDQLAATENFGQLDIEARRALKSASTNLKRFRDKAPKDIERKSCQQLINDIPKYRLNLEYTGASRVYVKGEELDKLLGYAVMGMCNGCTLVGKAAQRCPFRKEFGDQLIESDCQTGDCPYSFKFDKNEAWNV